MVFQWVSASTEGETRYAKARINAIVKSERKGTPLSGGSRPKRAYGSTEKTTVRTGGLLPAREGVVFFENTGKSRGEIILSSGREQGNPQPPKKGGICERGGGQKITSVKSH